MVPKNETESPAGARPMTRFQKVASALRGDRPDQAQAETGPGTDPEDAAVTPPGGVTAAEVRPDAASMPGTDPAEGRQDEMAAGTAGAGDPSATVPDVFGTTAGPDPGGTSAAYQDQAGVTGPADRGAGAVAPGASAVEAPAAPAEAERQPGEVMDALGDLSDIAYGNLIPEAAKFREQWHQIQFTFVDDPQGSVTQAADVVAQVTTSLEAAIQERQRIIAERQRSLRGRWADGRNADTDTLRETLRMYRAFLEQLLGSR